MTKKQYKFAVNICKGMNATKAAIDAGYSKKTAYSIGNENLKKPDIKNYIEQFNEKIIENDIADIKEIKKFLTQTLRGELNEEIIVIEQNNITGDQKARKIKKPSLIKDRLKAAELLGKTYQMYTDKVQISNDVIIISGEDELEE